MEISHAAWISFLKQFSLVFVVKNRWDFGWYHSALNISILNVLWCIQDCRGRESYSYLSPHVDRAEIRQKDEHLRLPDGRGLRSELAHTSAGQQGVQEPFFHSSKQKIFGSYCMNSLEPQVAAEGRTGAHTCNIFSRLKFLLALWISDSLPSLFTNNQVFFEVFIVQCIKCWPPFV
jgi:hypothetical protein